ncbi:hypothetical protein GSI_10396 [Ganoderma sinense ZZ0214-1]|uniref:GTP-binding protein 2 n=1 Tax=Ganoderma sinense ZZ0214-1 TaxID=1077348 RepID=A0A2G8S0F5_9APHY|nr:hypothetical protein GSI_10396 [Ganoderma sinense ZZ0214-1]
MFGEHESESPRVSSPWDPFLPSPPTPGLSPQSNAALHNGIPKLVPEVEEGNIEYKLKLTHISNARFARLVTQLKWRLLEGGGQAYYELGVADSGALIGLSRTDLEESLETLEMMAGEIGASVIIVKEIEVPPTIAALADKESGYTNPDTGEWTRKMRKRPLAVGLHYSDAVDGSTSATTTEVETDFSYTECTDVDDASLSFPPLGHGLSMTAFLGSATTLSHRPIRTNPSRPTAQSSPFIAPIDDDLALFSMEPEPAFQDESPETDTPASGVMADDELDLVVGVEVGLGPRRASFAGLEIAAVFKPRPVRHRARPGASLALGPTAGRHVKRYNKTKEKKVHPWQQKSTATTGQGEVSKEEKALQRRVARDKKREEKRSALIALAQNETDKGVCGGQGGVSGDCQKAGVGDNASAVMAEVGEEVCTLAHGVDGLHAALEKIGHEEEESGETSPVVEVRELVDMVAAGTGGRSVGKRD